MPRCTYTNTYMRIHPLLPYTAHTQSNYLQKNIGQYTVRPKNQNIAEVIRMSPGVKAESGLNYRHWTVGIRGNKQNKIW